ncbi:unnamed protein product, partial [Protopolystoma xenopodis]
MAPTKPDYLVDSSSGARPLVNRWVARPCELKVHDPRPTVSGPNCRWTKGPEERSSLRHKSEGPAYEVSDPSPSSKVSQSAWSPSFGGAPIARQLSTTSNWSLYEAGIRDATRSPGPTRLVAGTRGITTSGSRLDKSDLASEEVSPWRRHQRRFGVDNSIWLEAGKPITLAEYTRITAPGQPLSPLAGAGPRPAPMMGLSGSTSVASLLLVTEPPPSEFQDPGSLSCPANAVDLGVRERRGEKNDHFL